MVITKARIIETALGARFTYSGILRRKISGDKTDPAADYDFDSEDKIRAKTGRKADKK